MQHPTTWRRLAVLVPFAIAMLACQARVDYSAEESSIRKLESEWSRAAHSKDVATFVSFYAEDASVLPPNASIASDPLAIRRFFDSLMATPGFSLRFQSDKVVIAKAADLAHTQGTYHLTINDARGRPMTDTGKFVVVWRKQPDRSWKVFADIFNSDIPAAPPAP